MADDDLFGDDELEPKVPDLLSDEEDLEDDDLDMGTDEDEEEEDDELGASHLGAMGFGIEEEEAL